MIRNRIFTVSKYIAINYLLISKRNIVTLHWRNLANPTLTNKVITHNETNQHRVVSHMMTSYGLLIIMHLRNITYSEPPNPGKMHNLIIMNQFRQTQIEEHSTK